MDQRISAFVLAESIQPLRLVFVLFLHGGLRSIAKRVVE
jgi:hypothetical protein